MKLDAELKVILESLNAIDLQETFYKQNITQNDIKNLNSHDLEQLGISSKRALEFLSMRQKEDERKMKLKQILKEVDCEELYSILVKNPGNNNLVEFQKSESSSISNHTSHIHRNFVCQFIVLMANTMMTV